MQGFKYRHTTAKSRADVIVWNYIAFMTSRSVLVHYYWQNSTNSATRLDHRQAQPSLATVSRPKTVRIQPADPNELSLIQGPVSTSTLYVWQTTATDQTLTAIPANTVQEFSSSMSPWGLPLITMCRHFPNIAWYAYSVHPLASMRLAWTTCDCFSSGTCLYLANLQRALRGLVLRPYLCFWYMYFELPSSCMHWVLVACVPMSLLPFFFLFFFGGYSRKYVPYLARRQQKKINRKIKKKSIYNYI